MEDGSRKIVIPKGSLNADENNVIEIPMGCTDSKVLIAQPIRSGGQQPRPAARMGHAAGFPRPAPGMVARSPMATPRPRIPQQQQQPQQQQMRQLSPVRAPMAYPNIPQQQQQSQMVARMNTPMQNFSRPPAPQGVCPPGPICPAMGGRGPLAGSNYGSGGIEEADSEDEELERQEQVERVNFKEDLASYMKARRKMIYDIVTMEMVKARSASKSWIRNVKSLDCSGVGRNEEE